MQPYDKINIFGQSKYVTNDPLLIGTLTYESYQCELARAFVERVNYENKLNLKIEKDFDPPFCNIIINRTEKSPGMMKQSAKKVKS